MQQEFTQENKQSINRIVLHEDCMDTMSRMPNNYIDFTFTDIPYDGVNDNYSEQGVKSMKQLGRNVHKGDADKLLFSLPEFLDEVIRITNGNIMIFCGINQVSPIYDYLKASKKFSTVKQLVWLKGSGMPLNAKHTFVSSHENAIYAKTNNATFNSNYELSYSKFGRAKKTTLFDKTTNSEISHPTPKPISILKHYINILSNEGDLCYDPCGGSGSMGLACDTMGRRWIISEQKLEYCKLIQHRLGQGRLL